ncbi:MAG: hypothetical protein HY900_20435 [Deltaproteobacteria bacterium]|nr:hypothetical protein [Deltaproteobacteria bacterium]
MSGTGHFAACARWACGLLVAGFLVFGCGTPPAALSRAQVGIMPEGFARRPVSSTADAAAYVDSYAEALGLKGVRAVRALGFSGSYWVYVAEEDTDRSAFSLEVRADGEITARRFPTMDPEMMWNQKYGHRARPDLSQIEEGLTLAKAANVAREALPKATEVGFGKGSAYYGYVLFPLCQGGRLVGEAAVNTANGEVVWKRLPEPPRTAWPAPDTAAGRCN